MWKSSLGMNEATFQHANVHCIHTPLCRGCKCLLHSFRKHLDTMSPRLQTSETPPSEESWLHPCCLTSKSRLIWLGRPESLKSPGNVSKIIKEAVSFIKPWSKTFPTYCAFYIVSSRAKRLHLHHIIGFLWEFISGDRPKTGRNKWHPPLLWATPSAHQLCCICKCVTCTLCDITLVLQGVPLCLLVLPPPPLSPPYITLHSMHFLCISHICKVRKIPAEPLSE